MFAASMDITRAVPSSPGAVQGELHLATHGAGFHFSFQIAFKEEMKLKIQENAYSSRSKKKIKVLIYSEELTSWRKIRRLFIRWYLSVHHEIMPSTIICSQWVSSICPPRIPVLIFSVKACTETPDVQCVNSFQVISSSVVLYLFPPTPLLLHSV